MENEKNTPGKCQTEVDDSDNVFLDNRYPSHNASAPSTKHHPQITPTYTQFLFDPRDIRFHSTGSGSHRRTPSYDSRESTKSVSECSYVSGSPCESPRFHEMSLSSFSVASSATTAPPDDNPFHSEKDFVNYLLTLPPATAKSEMTSLDSEISTSTKHISGGQSHQGSPPQVGLNHLENLCKLMEQLGELREHNSKLQQRVQYLEEMRNLNEIRQNLKEVLEEAIATSPRVLGNEQCDMFKLPETKDEGGKNDAKRSVSSAVKMRSSNSKRRVKQKKGRSQSMGDDNLAYGKNAIPTYQKAKVSKWTKVKEALKWERVQADPTDNQIMVSKATVTLKTPVASQQKEVASEEIAKPKPIQPVKYLQKTDTMREIIVSPDPSTTQEVYEPKPTTPTKNFCVDSESSADDDELIDLTDSSNKRRSLGSNVIFDDRSLVEIAKAPTTKPKLVKESAVTDDDQVKMRKGRSLERGAARTCQSEKDNKKLSKGAWGKVKTILQTRKDSLRRKQRKSACLDANVEPGLSEGNPNEADEVWIEGADDRVTGSEVENYRSKSKHSSSSSNYGLDEPSFERVPSKSGTSKKVKPHLVIDIQPETECNLKGSDKGESSPTFQQTASCRGKKKGGRENERFSGCQSVPASPSNVTSFRYDDLDFLEEYFRENKDGNEHIMEVRVRDRLSLAERECHHHRPALFNLETIRNLEVMQRNVTEDFTKKMQDWERLKSNYNAHKQQGPAPNANQLQSSPHFDRKASSSFSGHRFRKTSKDKPAMDREQLKEEKHREKELQWLEKQLQKIEREKQRLAKERQKYLERESQLEKMRDTMLVKPGSKNKKEVLVKTSAGEFRFEGISKTFTRKLHEWETMKGIGPEVSTLTLLGGQKPKLTASRHASSRPSIVHVTKKGENDSLAPPINGSRLMERNRSHSESSLANMANVQTSTTSLVMRPADDDYNNDSEMYVDTDSSSVNALSCSRVNSEPEINFEGVTGEEVPCAIEVEQMHIEESLPCLEIHPYHAEKPVYSYAPVEVTQLIDSSSGSDAEKEVQIIEARNDGETSQHITNESFKFGESRVTQIKGPKSSLRNQDINRIKVPEEILENKYAEKERWKKKKVGVSKVKEISAELMHQAKTLEQTLVDKNVTIRQLQWELLQREMSSKRFQSQLEQGLLSELSSPTFKAKSSHQRSWSAAEAIGDKREIENESALNVLKKSDISSITSIGLAQKVDELKSELNNLWSSQESTTNSICSEIGTESVHWNKTQFKSTPKLGFNYSPQPQQLNETKSMNESETCDELVNQKTETSLKSVIIRRVSDSNVPQHPVSRISKLPMSPQMSRSKSLNQNVTPTSIRKVVQVVSPFPLPEVISPNTTPKNTSNGSPYLHRQNRVSEVPIGNGVKLNRQKRVESNKDACHLVLRRQNAEDFQSSSESDSESSNGVTFTINLNKSHRTKPSGSKESLSLIKAGFSPKMRTPSSPNVISRSASTWRENSKDEDMVTQTESDERVSAPSTPIVRSRSTRKLKPPSINKPTTGENPAVMPDSPLNKRFGSKDNTAPNVRLMIEKFNKKVNEVQTYTASSPNMSRNRSIECETASPGVKKSTSFTNSATNFDNDYSKFGYSSTQNPLNNMHVVKSASASVIEGDTYKNIISKPPLSPEVARKKTSCPSLQPVGIASRIPRCLTAISEQDNFIPKSPPTPHKATMLPDVTHSPTFGIRALEIKRAKENFLSKNPPTHPSGWRSLYQRPEQASGVTSSEAEEMERSMKPKSILKHNRPCETMEPAPDTSEEVHVRRGSMNELTEIDQQFSNQITKSASAGAVDFVTNFSKSRIPSQTSTDSGDKQQKSTCGLFNFKFRRPKLRHKKTDDVLPTVKTLCRQSLLVDFDTEVPQGSTTFNASNSCPSSPQVKSRQNSTKDSSDLAQYKSKSIFKLK